jgi:26S proteasome regulatory subunit T4
MTNDVRSKIHLWPTQHKLTNYLVIVKASSGPRYVVSYRPTLPTAKLKAGVRVSLDMTTLTIMRILPREVDPMVYKMSLEDPGGASFAGIGGLGEQVRELREVRPILC